MATKIIDMTWNGQPCRAFQCSNIEESYWASAEQGPPEPEIPARVTPRLRSRWNVQHLGMDVNRLEEGCDRRLQ